MSWAPHRLLRSLFTHRHLLMQFLRRDLAQRYEGSVVGVAWSLLLPLVMLAVYVFVFGVVFGPGTVRGAAAEAGAGAGAAAASPLAEIGLTLFSGMIAHALLTDCLVRAPQCVLSQPSYVKRIVFPLEVLPLTVVGSAYVQFLISWGVLVAAALWWSGGAAAGWMMLLGPVVVLPLVLMGAGIALALSALTVYLRDVAQVAPMVATVLMFLSPVFYPVERLPVALQDWIALSPLTVPIEALRAVTLHGVWPEPTAFGLHLLVSAAVLVLGWALFQATRRGFADVL